MEVQHKQQEGRGMFYVQAEGETRARMTYSVPDSSKIVIEHTNVDEAMRHQNIGYQMVDTAVQYARDHNLKIVPVCAFVKSVFDKKPEYDDVLQHMD